MEKDLTELTYVEEELAELQTRLRDSFTILDSLAQLQTKFESMQKIYHQLQDQLEVVKSSRGDFEQSKIVFNQKLAKIENNVESKLKEFDTKLEQFLNTHVTESEYLPENTIVELISQIAEVRQEVTQWFADFRQDLDSKQSNIERDLINEIIDKKINVEMEPIDAEIKLIYERVDEFGFNVNTALKVQSNLKSFEDELSLTKSFMTELGGRYVESQKTISDLKIVISTMKDNVRNLDKKHKKFVKYVFAMFLILFITVIMIYLN